MADSRIKDVSSLLSSFFNDDKLRRGELYSDFFNSWSSLVGSRLAAHSKVADVEKGMLVVEAEHPGWIQLLQLRQSGILDEAARRYPELGLKGIAFRLSGRGGVTRMPVSEKSADSLLPSPEKEEKESRIQAPLLEDIADPALRALLKGLKDSLQGED